MSLIYSNEPQCGQTSVIFVVELTGRLQNRLSLFYFAVFCAVRATRGAISRGQRSRFQKLIPRIPHI